MAGTFTAQRPVAFLHQFQHIPIANLGARKTDTEFAQRHFQSQIAHQCADHTTGQTATAIGIAGNDEQHFIAIDNFALAIHQDQPVTVTIQRNAEIGTARQHCFRQQFR